MTSMPFSILTRLLPLTLPLMESNAAWSFPLRLDDYLDRTLDFNARRRTAFALSSETSHSA